MEPKYIVVIGASAGGITALNVVLRELPQNIPAAIFVTIHLASEGESILPAILARTSGLPACHARDHQSIHAGEIYVAPPRFHMLIERGRVQLRKGPSENQQRPAINPLFRSAALAYGRKVIGIVLSGMLDDGAAGLAEIKRLKGLCIAQEPVDAMFGEMPRSAIAEANPHLCLTAVEIREFLVSLETLKSKTGLAKAKLLRSCHPNISPPRVPIRKLAPTKWKKIEQSFGPATGLICPDCGGPLWESEPGKAQQFRCLTGHAYSPQTLLSAQGGATERAMWAALRALEERAELQHRLAARARAEQNKPSARTFDSRAKETDLHAENLRQLILSQRN
jgi:two-component system, chemotaxis family, protein-glutamate methylesterase/glutaminase